MSDPYQSQIDRTNRRDEILAKLDAAEQFGWRTLPDGTMDVLVSRKEVADILARLEHGA
jgi:hypothetical protein